MQIYTYAYCIYINIPYNSIIPPFTSENITKWTEVEHLLNELDIFLKKNALRYLPTFRAKDHSTSDFQP